ncbi:hypothetical protein C1I95_20125 [Micromonospora craterilacus]|uniref:Uncharacterized protein n=1 Tax=Micromonospora craterilacus TaxID=1655439 RepID=A0A2W2EE37_9ACTN|nr:hypothetical protein C1I95_20125 [Micromonospora craterilacus]
MPAIRGRAAVGASRAVKAEIGIGTSAEDVPQSNSPLATGPAVFTAFQLADPAVVDVVRGEIPAWIELVEGDVDGIGELGSGHGLPCP